MRAPLLIGTEKGTRTPTPIGHNHLKVACLPIPPPRHYNSLATSRNIAEFFFTSSLGLEVRQLEQRLAFALREPVHHLLPAFASLPALRDLANLPESAVELSL